MDKYRTFDKERLDILLERNLVVQGKRINYLHPDIGKYCVLIPIPYASYGRALEARERLKDMPSNNGDPQPYKIVQKGTFFHDTKQRQVPAYYLIRKLVSGDRESFISEEFL